MRVVVTGATGNVGTSLVRRLADEPAVGSVVGVARRVPAGAAGLRPPGVAWVAADVAADDLAPIVRGADAVVHLAWAIQPSRDRAALHRANVLGSARVFAAAEAAGVPALVHASSVGAYSPGPKDRAVDESWPAGGISTSFYARHKAEVERLLDRVEAGNPGMRVVRMRPALTFKAEAAKRVRRLFAGPLVPGALWRPSRIPVVPDIPGLRVQGVHADDVAEAYRLALVGDARGAFNLAADPVLDPASLADILGARRVPVPARAARAAMDLAWRLRLQPSPPGWLDMALKVPLMDAGRARDVLGWRPRIDAGSALRDLLAGTGTGRAEATPALAARLGRLSPSATGGRRSAARPR
jgi:nucleoside-diphosphate-sugar epimerase